MLVRLHYILNGNESLPLGGDSTTTINFFTSLPETESDYYRSLVIPKSSTDTYTYETWIQPEVVVSYPETDEPQAIKFYATPKLTASLYPETIMYFAGVAPEYVLPVGGVKSKFATTPLSITPRNKITIPIHRQPDGTWKGDYLVLQLYIKSNNFGFVPLTLENTFKFDILTI